MCPLFYASPPTARYARIGDAIHSTSLHSQILNFLGRFPHNCPTQAYYAETVGITPRLGVFISIQSV